MIAYIIRRLLYAVPIVIGGVLLTFVLFFIANKPKDMARRALGPHADEAAIEKWIFSRGYDLPPFYNPQAEGTDKLTRTMFYQKCARLETPRPPAEPPAGPSGPREIKFPISATRTFTRTVACRCRNWRYNRQRGRWPCRCIGAGTSQGQYGKSELAGNGFPPRGPRIQKEPP